VINRVNGLRKDTGLAVEDRIELFLHPVGDELLGRALSEHRALIQSETLARSLSVQDAGAPPPDVGAFASFPLDEGRTLLVRLAKA
jgi:hypothetical protein